MRRDIKLYVNSCPNCDPFKKFSKPISPLGYIPASDRGDLVAIDVFGGKQALKTTAVGNRYVFVMIDVFTKYCRATPTPNQTAETLADRFTNEWILQLGAPHRVLSDQGTAFESALFQNMCTLWRIDKRRTTPYHPCGNGVCERVNGTLINGLQRLHATNPDTDWDLLLPRVVFAYNTAVHSTTGFSPFRLMFGEDCRFPV